MYEAGSPLAFYKHGGRVEFRTTEKKKKKKRQCSNYCAERGLNTRAPHCNASAPATWSRSRRLFLVIIIVYSYEMPRLFLIEEDGGKKKRLVLYKVNIPEEHAKHFLDSADKLKVSITRTHLGLDRFFECGIPLYHKMYN